MSIINIEKPCEDLVTPYRSAPIQKKQRDWSWLKCHGLGAAKFGIAFGSVAACYTLIVIFFVYLLEPGKIDVQIINNNPGQRDTVRVKVESAVFPNQWATCSVNLPKQYQDRCKEAGWDPNQALCQN